ncbi:MAG: hypothetical protein FKGGLIKP_00357 [Sodalis sp. Fse]|nr:MAG: hypothetical protein FKGGLIKP_00357 [Sodalis sp. Fse]
MVTIFEKFYSVILKKTTEISNQNKHKLLLIMIVKSYIFIIKDILKD